MIIHGTRSHLQGERRRGITLLLTMLVLVLAVTFLGREMLESTVVRMSSMSATFSTESRWIAEGVARQWQERSHDPKMNVDDLLRPVSWDFGAVPMHVEVLPTSTQNKLPIAVMNETDWVSFWQKQPSRVTLADEPARKLLESGDSALEVILGPKHIAAQDAYVANGITSNETTVPFDVLTIWGDGHLDLNRASREVLQGRFPTFSDAQISGIFACRTTGPMTDTERLVDELSLSADQSELLRQVAAFAPKSLELLIHVRRGGVAALYWAVITLGKDGQVLEVRPIL